MSNFLELYLDYTSQNEAPELFHKWIAVSVVGAVLERRIYFDKYYYKCWPAHYVVLVAPSGRCKKTTAAGIGVALLRELGGINIIADKSTPEGAIRAMQTQQVGKFSFDTTGVIYAPELAVMLGKEAYNQGFVSLLTTLADAPSEWQYTTVKGGKMTLKNVAVSFIACTTVDWMAYSVSLDIWGGGFMSRCIFVCQNSTDRVSALPSAPKSSVRKELIELLKQFRTVEGEVTFNDEARELYVKFYHSNKLISVTDKKMEPYYERRPDAVIRLCLVLSVINGCNRVIDELTLRQAINMVSELEQYLPDFMAELNYLIAHDLHHKLLRTIIQGGSVSHKKLVGEYCGSMTSRKLTEHIVTLLDAGFIEIDQNATERAYVAKGGSGDQ